MSYIIKKLSDPTTLKITVKLAVGWLKATVNTYITYYLTISDSVKSRSFYFWELLATSVMWPPIEVTVSSLIKRFVRYSAGIRKTEAQDEEKEIGEPSEPSISPSSMILTEKIDTTNDLLVQIIRRVDALILIMEAAHKTSVPQPSLER